MGCEAEGLVGHTKKDLARRMIDDFFGRMNRGELFPLSSALINQCLHGVIAQLIALSVGQYLARIMVSTGAVLVLGNGRVHGLWADGSRI